MLLFLQRYLLNKITMKKGFIVVFLVILFTNACDIPIKKEKKTTLYKIETEYGDMIFKLYDQTPLHKENFKKLIDQEYFDGLLFHRVIEGFMIQGGDPDSRNAKPGELLGNGGSGYTIPAEIIDTFFHKKGVIAAAREGDEVNPEMRSAGSQFYIVQGKVFSDEDIEEVENRINASRLNKLTTQYIKEAEQKALDTGGNIDYPVIVREAREKAKKEFKQEGMYKIPPLKRKVYQTIGGTPHLDGAYTVFGEVIEGIEVIDKIAAVKTDDNDRPVKNVKMKITKL